MEKRYSDTLDAFIFRTTSGEDWVGYETADKTKHGTTTLHKWNSMPTEPENLIPDEEWPYPQEG